MKMRLKRFIILAAALLMLSSMASAQYMAWDPTRHIPNGRVLALGKAYMGLADDSGAIYSNPAGLAGIQRWQLCSMSGKFLEEYTYLSMSGLYPTENGVFGLGFAGSFIGGAYVTKVKAGSDPADPIYEIDFSVDPVSNYNNVAILAYGNQADKLLKSLTLSDRVAFFRHPLFSNLSLGMSLKFFFTGLTGDHIAEGQGLATGNELDLGLQYQPPQKWLKLGVTVQNVLPYSMGGKLAYATGHEESYPAILESGAAIRLVGNEDSIWKYRNQEILLLLDFDYYPTLADYPILYHTGVEWRPSPMFAIRMGLDQDAAASETGTGMTSMTNVSGGVGLLFGGFRFDYAYHQYTAAPGMDNSFFSLTYGVFPPEKEMPRERIKIYMPEDKLLTFDETVVVSGEVLIPEITHLYINDTEIKLLRPGPFELEVPLEIGKNKIVVEGYGKKGKLEAPLASEKVRILRLITFPDVPPGYWVRKPISLIAMQGIIKGYPDGSFKPDGNITRAEMATLLIRTNISEEALPKPASMVFTDVKLNHWAAKFIAEAARTGVVLGYPDGSFKPNGNITRAEGLTMITRFAGVSKEAYAGEFPDVKSTHWAADTIAGGYKVGMLEYLMDRNFEPSRKLTRSESVEMLYKTPYVTELLAMDLLDWDSY